MKTIITKRGIPTRETLLQKALSIPNHKRKYGSVTPEEIELGLAWMRDEVTLTQVMGVVDQKGTGNVYARLAVWLREAYRQGTIQVVK